MLLTGLLQMILTKGGQRHQKLGRIFVWSGTLSMVVMGAFLPDAACWIPSVIIVPLIIIWSWRLAQQVAPRIAT